MALFACRAAWSRYLDNAIFKQAENRAPAAEMGRKGRRCVEIEFDRDKLAAMMLEELQTVAAR